MALVDIEIARRTAAERESLHLDDASGRQLTANTHLSGLRGEFALGEMIGQYPDLTRRKAGDGGVDFVVPILMTIDVKTRKERLGGTLYMLVEEGKVDADIYVCAILSKDETRCECVGWMSKRDVLGYPVGDLGTGVRNHQVPVENLLPMESLTRRIPNWRGMM